MTSPGAEPSEDSEARINPISQTDLDPHVESRLAEGAVPQADPDAVPLDSLWVEHRHQEQGIRLLVRPFEKDLSGSNSFQAGSDSWQWLTLRTDVPSLYQKPEHMVIAVTQTSKDIKFSFRIPGKTRDKSIQPPLWGDLFYDPMSDNVILLNKSDIPFSLCDVSNSSRHGIAINPGLTKSLTPGTWRISFADIAVLDFRILEKYPVMVYEHRPHTISENPPTSSDSHKIDSREKKRTLMLNEKHVLRNAPSVLESHNDNDEDEYEDAAATAQSADPLAASIPPGTKKPRITEINPLLDAGMGQTIAISGIGELDEYKFHKLGPSIASTSLSFVYAAEHSKIPDLIAVKVLKTRITNQNESLYAKERNIIRQAEMWMRESQILADLQHKSIVPYYGSDARFLSVYMEFVDAKDLTASPLWRNKTSDEFQGNRYDALRILVDIAGALTYIHGKDLVHNDTKPANILYSPERGAVLCDFGLSATIHNSPRTGGTPYYIPPEFIAKKLRGPPSDVWALGITMLYVLRKIPFPDSRSRRQHPRPLYWQISGVNNPAVPHKHFGNGEPAVTQMQQWLSEIKEIKETLDKNDLLEQTVSKMLETSPRRRITMDKLLQELATFHQGAETSLEEALALLLEDALSNIRVSDNSPAPTDEEGESHIDRRIITEEDAIGFHPHSSLVHTQESEKLSNKDYEASLESIAPPTDSGYASVPTIDGKPGEPRKQSAQDTTPSKNPEERDISDTVTEYSMASSVPTSRKQGYIWELAEDLFVKLSALNADEKAQTRISETLPELLKAFALKVGHDAPTQMHRDVMAFVHRNRREIATAFTNISFKQEEESTQRSTDHSGGMDLTDIMSLWYEKEDVEDGRLEEELGDLDLDDLGPDQPTSEALGEVGEVEDEDDSDSWLVAYRGFVSSSEAYQWLLSRLKREFSLVPTEPNAIQAIRDNIMAVLPPVHKVSRKASSTTYGVNFEIDWDILGFFETQQYFKQPSEALEGVITLTGSYQDAQAATCAQYLLQTWPVTGADMLELIKGALQQNNGESYERKLSDGTAVSAVLRESKLKVEVQGVAASIAEVGEQLAWLGAALRSSPRGSGLVHCTPIIGHLPHSNGMLQQPGLQQPTTKLICNIGFIIEEAPDPQPLQKVNGQCWHDIFRNPVIVKGYPIPQRPEWNTGLEIPLKVMAGLADTQQIDRFKDRLYIKGFSTMLVPTKKNEDIVSWHLIYNKNGDRISYLDDYVDQQQHLGHLDLESHRHVLGWCTEAKFYAGSAEAHHPVTHSQLPKPPAGFALAGINVSAGKIILGGPAFNIGVKDSAVHITRKGIIRRLKWISTKFVLLWDERDKRGWLINGTSALLHIVRASLAHASEDSFSSAFLFKSEDLHEAKEPHTANSAIEVLLNPLNRSLKLYEEDEDDGGTTLLKTQIDHFYNIMEKIIDHQVDIAGESGVKLSNQPRGYLEGWDFEDLTTDCDPLHPRVATLEPAGKGWVDFIRAIQAVTLFGSGFGDIIRPSGSDICEHWAELPKKQYFIAGCLSDMSRLMKDVGNYGDNRVRLTDNLICHTPTTSFVSCRCRGVPGQDHSEPVQVLFPSMMAGVLPTDTPPIEARGSGAVIFGQNSSFSWAWGDTGDPSIGEPGEAMYLSRIGEKDTDSLKDSDFGRSSSWSASEAIFSPQSTRSTRFSIRSPSEFPASISRSDSSVLIDSKIYMPDEYTVGIICALPKELLAVRVLFDHRHNSLGTEPGDSNQYALGDIAGHWVVAACLPAGEYGTNSAASVASNMCRSFTSLRFCLLVGIAGGAPSEKRDIRLGDVVIGQPTGTNSGVLQYDRGKENEGSQFQLTGVLQPPPRVLTNAISSLQSDPDLRADPLGPYLRKIAESLPEYRHPGPELDVLFPAVCAICTSENMPRAQCMHMLQRVPRTTTAPAIHYGLVASGNRVVKDAAFRDRLAEEHDVLCFEMEAAGVINTVNCLVIRGICDYCDAKKNDVWQEYAAATAAAYAKLLLSVVATVGHTRVFSVRGDSEEPASKKRKVEFERI